MGTHFFQKPGPISGSNTNQLARAVNSGTYGARAASVGDQKDIGAAQGINKAIEAKRGQPLKRSAAYPPGPKV
jgi:hypothetical protein